MELDDSAQRRTFKRSTMQRNATKRHPAQMGGAQHKCIIQYNSAACEVMPRNCYYVTFLASLWYKILPGWMQHNATCAFNATQATRPKRSAEDCTNWMQQNSQPGTAKSIKKNAREPTKLPRRVLHQVAIYNSYNTTEYEGMAIQHMPMHTP